MKTRVMIVCRNLLGMVLCSTILMAACQQESNPVPEQMDRKEILANAGKIHNELISYYYNNRLMENALSEEGLSELLDLSWDYLDKESYDSNCSLLTRRLIKEKIKYSNLKSAAEGGYSVDPSCHITKLSETDLYSQLFLEEVSKILILAKNQNDRQVIRDYVNSSFSILEFEDEDDITAQQLFVSIFNGSYDFWETMDNPLLKGTQLRRSSWVIINDGIGGVLGLVFGPIGSIVTATAFSVATNEEIKNETTQPLPRILKPL